MNIWLATGFTTLLSLLCVLNVFLEHDVKRARADAEARRQDIEVLRVAVFNHLRHGGDPQEEHIREVLGFGERE